MENRFRLLIIALLTIPVFFIGYHVFISTPQNDDSGTVSTPTPTTPLFDDEQVFCTMDVKLCPDGSSVGRQGPECEFAPCPSETETSDTKPPTLEIKAWTWTEDANFSITLENSTLTTTTDCNAMGGVYAVEGTTLTFTDIISTEMYCENSLESEFRANLHKVTGYSFDDNKQLILSSATNQELMVFK